MFKWKYGQFMPFYAPDSGANGGGEGNNDGNGEQGVETDYKALYEKALADSERQKSENAKLKASFDKTASEVAELKRVQKAKMSDDEKAQAEREEVEQENKALRNRLFEMETTTLFAEQGFDKKDYGELVKQVVEVGGEKASELSSAIIEFVKKANKAAVANAKNAAIKDGAVPPKTSTAQATDTPFAEQAIAYSKRDDKSQEIKNKYRK